MPKPLKPPSKAVSTTTDEIEDGPEALMISALLESGSFDPSPHGLTVDDLQCWEQLWNFGVEYHASAGTAPPHNLVMKRFPDFVITPNVSVNYAAHLLRSASHERRLRADLGKALDSLRDGDLEAVHEVMEGVQRPRTTRKPPVDGFSHDNINEDFETDRIPVPHHSLGRVSGGVGMSELWYIAARPGNGKTYTACTFVAEAIKYGYDVSYVSAEMPSRRINQRIARVLTNGNVRLLTLLASKDPADQKKALDELREKVPGSWSTVDPSHGRMTNGFIREQMYGKQLVVVDHMGLLRTNKGARAIDDWRAMAEISNTLREDNLAVGTPVLGLVQINRAGESAGNSAPKGSTLSQSDALLQDCDVLVTMKRLSKHVMVHSAEKVREADTPKWYSRYDPAKVNFKELTKEQAYEIVATDDSFEED